MVNAKRKNQNAQQADKRKADTGTRENEEIKKAGKKHSKENKKRIKNKANGRYFAFHILSEHGDGYFIENL
jgi:hypothetical protein